VQSIATQERGVTARDVNEIQTAAVKQLGEPISVDPVTLVARGAESSAPPIADNHVAEPRLERVAYPPCEWTRLADDPCPSARQTKRFTQGGPAGRNDRTAHDDAASVSDRNCRCVHVYI
jgi:hypothetical protein